MQKDNVLCEEIIGIENNTINFTQQLQFTSDGKKNKKVMQMATMVASLPNDQTYGPDTTARSLKRERELLLPLYMPS